ncbi:MAG: TRAP transporter substrate-binding protein DctP [Gammaproteobacteria bacterium]|nr:TRAP transporter substrate-binding protein DctP [Gammaproteobacteria bacterium]
MIVKKLIQLCLLLPLIMVMSPIYAKTIKIATISPDGTLWMNEMRAGAKEIKEKTQGRVILKFYPGGVMGSDENVLRKIHIGQLQGGAVTTGSLTGAYPDIDIYSLPYLFSSLEQVSYVREKMDQFLLDELEKNGFVSFGFGEGGFTYMMSDSSLYTVEDVRKQKVWIPGGNKVGEAVFSSADISPVTLPLSDVLTGLQTGLVDTVITSPIGAIALQWHTRVKYVIDVPLTYVAAMLVIDKKAFSKIKKEDQSIVREVMTSAFKRIDAANRRDNQAAQQALKQQGIEYISLPKASLDAWHVIGEKAINKLKQDNSYAPAIYNKLMGYVNAAKKNK